MQLALKHLLLSGEGSYEPVATSCGGSGGFTGLWVGCPGMYGQSSGPIVVQMHGLFTVVVYLCML